jgi:hypothetical protein
MWTKLRYESKFFIVISWEKLLPLVQMKNGLGITVPGDGSLV